MGTRQIFGVEQEIEELTQAFTDKWCKDFDDGADFRKCENFLREDNTLLIGCATDVDLSTLAKAKRLGRLDHYDVNGRALYLFIRNRTAAEAVNTFVSQAI